jgi:Skp family chaperone for outer membrane proteins
MRTCHLVLALPLLVAAVHGQEDKSKSKSGILILNMLRAIDDSDEGRSVVTKLREEMATQKQRYTDEKTKLQETVKQLLQLKPSERTPEFWKQMEEAMETDARLEREKNIVLAKKGEELSRALQQIVQGAQQEARAIMKERGAEIVLLSKTGPIELMSDQDFQQEMLMRRVLCHDDAVDITGEVIERMNKWYKENKSAQGAPKREGAEGAGKEPAKDKGTPVKEGPGKTG